MILLLTTNLSVPLLYVNVAFAPSIVKPAPLAADALAAPSASVKFKSLIFTVVLLIDVCVPSTCKSPAITTVPVLSPTADGSITKLAGPAK